MRNKIYFYRRNFLHQKYFFSLFWTERKEFAVSACVCIFVWYNPFRGWHCELSLLTNLSMSFGRARLVAPFGYHSKPSFSMCEWRAVFDFTFSNAIFLFHFFFLENYRTWIGRSLKLIVFSMLFSMRFSMSIKWFLFAIQSECHLPNFEISPS